MNRVLLIALGPVLAAVLLLVPTAPALAYGGPPPDPDVTLPPAEVDDALAGGTTPCSTILISSDSWGPGTQVTAIRDDPGDPDAEQTDCDEDTSTTVGLTGPQDGAVGFAEEAEAAPAAPALPGTAAGTGSNGTQAGPDATTGGSTGAALGTATADDDGVLSLVIRIPADAPPGAFGYTLVGTAESGEARQVAERLTIAPLADDFAPVEATVLQATGVAVWQLLAGVVLLLALVWAFFGGPLRVRRRRG